MTVDVGPWFRVFDLDVWALTSKTVEPRYTKTSGRLIYQDRWTLISRDISRWRMAFMVERLSGYV